MRKKTAELHLRCEPEIKLVAKLRAAELGLSISDMFTESILTDGYTVVNKNPEIAKFHGQLSSIGRNLNQMVRAMNLINLDSKKYHNVNLYLNNDDFRSIAEQLDVLINEFQDFNKRFTESEKELCKAMSNRVLFSDVEDILKDNPDLIKRLQSRREV